MTGDRWNHFFQTHFGPVFFEGRDWVDFDIIPRKLYPALDRLRDCSELEILVLAWLIIINAGQEYEADTWSADDELVDMFGNYDCHSSEVSAAITSLLLRGLIEYGGVNEETGAVEVRAKMFNVWRRGLIELPYDAVYREMGMHDDRRLKVLLN
jgi:hypothetical protein